MRCHICNFVDFSKTDCHDQSDDVPGRNSVHYRKDLKEDVCSYCYKLIVKNRKFYAYYFSELDNVFRMPKAITKSANDNNGRPEQKDQEKPPTLPEPKVSIK